MSEVPPTAAEGGEAAGDNENMPRAVRLEAIEAPVRFDLGETLATIRTLQSLQAGYVFELPRRVEDAVTISVNGAVVARGELVRIGERLGVRVVEVLSDASVDA